MKEMVGSVVVQGAVSKSYLSWLTGVRGKRNRRITQRKLGEARDGAHQVGGCFRDIWKVSDHWCIIVVLAEKSEACCSRVENIHGNGIFLENINVGNSSQLRTCLYVEDILRYELNSVYGVKTWEKVVEYLSYICKQFSGRVGMPGL